MYLLTSTNKGIIIMVTKIQIKKIRDVEDTFDFNFFKMVEFVTNNALKIAINVRVHQSTLENKKAKMT